MVARVTINGASFPLVIKSPFIKPRANPRARVITIAMPVFMPFCKSPAKIAEVKAKVDPTDRSIPPVRITKVIPSAMNPFIIS